MTGRIAIIGGGWAGMAAAVTLAAAGRAVCVFEAARVLGGRARRVDLGGRSVDNGQHILLGASAQTLALVRTVHGGPQRGLFDRRRLHLEQPGVFRLKTAPLPVPWHLVTALLTARGLSQRERLSTVAFVGRLRRSRYRCPGELTVATLLAGQPAAAVHRLWAPLCVAALNTPIETASAQVFLNVLRLAFAARARDSDLLLPRLDLTALFPAPAAAYVEARGGEIRLGEAVGRVAACADGVRVATQARDERFAAAIVAVGPHQLAEVLGSQPGDAASLALARVGAFSYQPIHTIYLHYPRPLGLSLPMVKLDGNPGQWLFDRGQLGGAPGLAAVVISTALAGGRVEHDALAQAAHTQLQALIPGLPPPAWTQTIAERRATYACVAGLARPAAGALLPRLYLAGDYTDDELPPTLEAATRSGVAAARQLLADCP